MSVGEGRSTPLYVELFNGLRICYAGASESRFRTQKTAGLLAYLAFHHPQGQPREILAQLLWPEALVDAGRRSLNTALWALRQQLDAVGVAGAEVLAADRKEIGFRPGTLVTDVGQFERRLREAAVPGRSPAERHTLWREAVELYRGELLRGFYDDWLLAERQRLALLYQETLGQLVQVLQEEGDPAGAVRFALRAVADDPLSEPACARLMRLAAGNGETSLALLQYRELERRLREELDAAPSPELRRLAQQIAVGSTRPRAVPDHTSREETPALRSPLPPPVTTPESIGGAVPLGSALYVERAVDRAFIAAVTGTDGTVLVKGPRQSGKTSLLVRALAEGRTRGAEVVFSDLQTLGQAELSSPDAFYRSLAEMLADQLDLAVRPHEVWDGVRSPAMNLRRYLRKTVLELRPRRIVWALDEVDQLFTCPFGAEVFALFRSWHNERTLEPDGPWSRLVLVLAYSTEAHLYLSDLSQSPFNVGTRLELPDFQPDEVAELARRSGIDWGPNQLPHLLRLVEGHPYLVRRALRELAVSGRSLDDNLAGLARLEPGGPFQDHLERLLAPVLPDSSLCDALRSVLTGSGRIPETPFLRLRAAGLLVGSSPASVRFRCGLYQAYCRRVLLNAP